MQSNNQISKNQPDGPKKILRKRSSQNGGNPFNSNGDQLRLERVLGITCSSSASLSCDPASGLVAYPAGCTVVLYSHRKGQQQSHIVNVSRKTITCLTFSPDGRYLATGEYGHEPALRIWDTQDATCVTHFTGHHKYGISCVAFSPNGKYLVSVGTQHDMIISVYNWRSGTRVANNRISCKVNAISFSEKGEYFVTVGVRHVKFWYLDRKSNQNETVPIVGRSAILADHRNNIFFDVACGKGEQQDRTFCITQSGLLCDFNSRRLLDRWVDLKTKTANSVCVTPSGLVFVGCADAVVHVFDAVNSLSYLTMLPKSHYLGKDISVCFNEYDFVSKIPNARHPDTVAVTFDDVHNVVSCVYNDHSFYQWDVADLQCMGKVTSELYHSGGVWNIETYPSLADNLDPIVPPGSFVTCGADDTIRFWQLQTKAAQNQGLFDNPNRFKGYQPNAYGRELLKIMFTDPTHLHLCEQELLPGTDKDNLRNGVRVVRFNPSGTHLAVGDRSGNLRVFHLDGLVPLVEHEAHDQEISCIEYTTPAMGVNLMASASRDRLIHLFDAGRDYNHLITIDDHSSSISAVQFAHFTNQMHLLSCGSDRCIIYRDLTFSVDRTKVIAKRERSVSTKASIVAMQVDAKNRSLFAACLDRNVRVYTLQNGKQRQTHKSTVADEGNLNQMKMDPSSQYAVTASSDKSINVYDTSNWNCVANVTGHSEIVTAITFTPDGKRILTSSADGCVFVWHVTSDMTERIKRRMTELDDTTINEKEELIQEESGSESGTFDTDPDNATSRNENDQPRAVMQPEMPPSTPANLPQWGRAHWSQLKQGSVHLAVNNDESMMDTPMSTQTPGQQSPGFNDSFQTVFNGDQFQQFDTSSRNTNAGGGVNTTRGVEGFRQNLTAPRKSFDFGSMSEMHHVRDEDDRTLTDSSWFNGHQQQHPPPAGSAARVYMPHSRTDSNISGSAFEVHRDSRSGQNGSNYRRSDSMGVVGGVLSDDDDDSPISPYAMHGNMPGASAPDLVAAYVAEQRKAVFPVRDEDSPPPPLSSLAELEEPGGSSHKGEAFFAGANTSMDHRYYLPPTGGPVSPTGMAGGSNSLNRNSPLRQSITSRHLSKGGDMTGHNAHQRPNTLNQQYDQLSDSSVSREGQSTNRSGHRSAQGLRPESATSSLSTDRSDQSGHGTRMGGVIITAPGVASTPASRRQHGVMESPHGDSPNSGNLQWSGGRMRHGSSNHMSPSRRPPRADDMSPASPAAAPGWVYRPDRGSSRDLASLTMNEQYDDLNASTNNTNNSLYRKTKSMTNLARDKTRRRTLPSHMFDPGYVIDEDVATSSYDLSERTQSPARMIAHSAANRLASLRRDSAMQSDQEGLSGSQSRLGGSRQKYSYFGPPPGPGGQYQSPQKPYGMPTDDDETGGVRFGLNNLSKLNSMSMGALNGGSPSPMTIYPGGSPGGGGIGEPSPMFRKISDLRTKLKKSTENINEAGRVAPARAGHLRNFADPDSNYLRGSKSISNLAMLNRFPNDTTPPRKQSTPDSASNLGQSQSLTKSLSNLSALRSGHPQAATPPKSLGSTLSELKRLSQSDLRNVGTRVSYDMADPYGPPDEGMPMDEVPPLPNGQFYDRASTLPRSRRTGSSVQKKAEGVRSHKNVTPGSDNVSVSGESTTETDSCELNLSKVSDWSDNNSKTGSNNWGAGNNGGESARRSTRSNASVTGIINSFEQQRPAVPPRRNLASTGFQASRLRGNSSLATEYPGPNSLSTPKKPNYLAQLLTRDQSAAGGMDREAVGTDEATSSAGEDAQYEKMLRHCEDTAGHLKTYVDKTIHAFKLINDDGALSAPEREKLRSQMATTMQDTVKRLAYTIGTPLETRTEPEGEAPTVGHNSPPQNSQGKAIPQAQPSNTAQILDQYSDVLISLLQEKMAQQQQQHDQSKK